MKREKNSGFIVLVMMMSFALLFSSCDGGGSSGGITVHEPNTDWYTKANPGETSFLINNADDLAGLAQLVNDGNDFSGKTIILTVNMDLSGYRSGKGWTPIGDSSNPFSGTFEGSNKTITNLFINNEDVNAGLFGNVQSGTIRKIHLVDVDITGKGSAGSLVGNGYDTTISNCSASGSVKSETNTGGIAGFLQMSDITNCCAEVKVTGVGDDVNKTGGLVGFIEYGAIANCYTTGEVSGNTNVGGVVGHASYFTVSKCYASGAVTGTGSVGGIAGRVDANSVNKGYLEYCVALNPGIYRLPGSTNTYFGKVLGLNNSVADVFVNDDKSLEDEDMEMPDGPLTGDDGGETKTKAEVKSEDLYGSVINWFFGSDDDNPWKWGGPVYPLPVLYWQTEASYPVLPTHLE